MGNGNLCINNDSHGRDSYGRDNTEAAEIGVKTTARRRNGRLGRGCVSSGAPCGACKLLRRNCTEDCIFAPYFGSNEGVANFSAVYKVFGADNVAKLLLQILQNRRQEAVVTMCYEAQARLADPVYGCVPKLLAKEHQLQQQVDALRKEVEMARMQVMKRRMMGISQQPDISNKNSASGSMK